jgi:hypothetical protein
MMGATHALMGMVIALSSLHIFPGFFELAVIAGFLGGIFPDLDMVFQHRKTLHYPVIYLILGVVASAVAVLSPGFWTIGTAFFLVSSALHSWIDILGGGLEEKPWKGESDRAVYSRVLDRWFEPRQWIRYDGAPEDFLLCLVLAVPVYMTVEGSLELLVIATVLVGGIYTLVRKKLLDWAPERLVEFF